MVIATCCMLYTTAGVPVGEVTVRGQIRFKGGEKPVHMTTRNLHCNSSIHNSISECSGATLGYQSIGSCYSDFYSKYAEVVCEGQLHE